MAKLEKKAKVGTVKPLIKKSRRRKTVKPDKVKPKQLLSLLPADLLEQVGRESKVDAQVKHLHGPLLVYLFILAILKDKSQSLSSLVEVYNSREFSIFSGKGGHKTAKNSLSDRFSTIKYDFLKKVYDGLIAGIQMKYGKAIERQFGNLQRFDSTMVSLCASLTKVGMTVGAKSKTGEGKVQVKVSIGMESFLPSALKTFTDQGHLSEEKALKETIESTEIEDCVSIFDMGLKSRKTLKAFDDSGRLFVTRSKNPRHETIRVHKQIKGRKHGNLCFEFDEIVHLYQSGGNDKILEHEFRLIKATSMYGDNANQTYYFLTNILDLTAFEIADIYKRRWDIEIFFRFMKQHIGLRDLLSTKDNGIKAVIYLRFIVGVLIWSYIHLNGKEDHKGAKYQFEEAIQSEIDVLKAKMLSSISFDRSKFHLIGFQGLMWDFPP